MPVAGLERVQARGGADGGGGEVDPETELRDLDGRVWEAQSAGERQFGGHGRGGKWSRVAGLEVQSASVCD